MSTISNMIAAVKSLNIEKVSVDSLEETSEQRVEANRLQMSKGLNAEGGIIGTYKSREYAAFKQGMGSQAPFGIVDLRLTKEFSEAIKSSVTGNTIITDSTDSKSPALQGKYNRNGNIFGLSTTYKADYISKDLRPLFQSKVSQQTGLKFK